jgi:DNA-binding winged helix-turn-helix (wHTH) protein
MHLDATSPQRMRQNEPRFDWLREGGLTNAATYRFGSVELDEGRRALTAHGREIKLQPRVFDLLCYLVRHRDRVVSKDELLEGLWPGTVVVDNALQRVVSLARSALAEAGLPDAVRTYPRHGYRFCFDGECGDLAADRGATGDEDADLATARAAVARMDWPAAVEAYAAADARAPLAAADVEAWGRAAICAGSGPSVVAVLERSLAEREAAGDALAAARATLLLAQIRIDQRQGVLGGGLLQRAARYLDGRDASAERGHYAWMAARMAVAAGDAERALRLADEAVTLGRALRDPDVECLGLIYRGHALIARGEVAEGLAQHEEAAAMARHGSVCAWVTGWALCSVLYAARHRCDWLRAGQYADAYEEWSRDSRMPAFPGTCQLHRAAVLSVQGEHERASAEARIASSLLSHAAPWAEGDAYCVLGDIQLSTGDFDAAEASYRQAHALGWDPQPGLARLHLLTGRPELALRGLERALEEGDWTLRERRGQLLCLMAQAAVAAGEVERARGALRTLSTDPQMIATDALKALHCAAQAEVAIAEGDFVLAARQLRQAVRHWREVGSRTGEAETRLRLAECLLMDRDTAGCELELHAVESNLQRAMGAYRGRLEALRETLKQGRRQESA